MDEVKIFVCKCGIPTPQMGRAVAWNPNRNCWYLVTWDCNKLPVPIIGLSNVAGCPVCQEAVNTERTVPVALGPPYLGELFRDMEEQLRRVHSTRPEDMPADSPRVPDWSVELPEPREV